MAVITFDDLIDAIKSHPRYFESWRKDVNAETALKVKFGGGEKTSLQSNVLPVINGSELVLTLDAEGRVVSLEIT